MSKTNWSSFDVSDDAVIQLTQMCPENTFIRILASKLPEGVYPEPLQEKCTDVLITNSGSPDGHNYLFLNGNRVDGEKIDQVPFVVVRRNDETNSSGYLRHHSDHHSDRTILKPKNIDLGSTELFKLKTMPEATTGDLENLAKESQIEARQMLFDKVQNEIQSTGSP